MAKTGRPRLFDREKALEAAMLLFWEKGYDMASLSLLKDAMGGISAPSFYAAFDSKERLFSEALDLYVSTYGRVHDSLWDPEETPYEAVEKALRRSVRMQTAPGKPRGCLLSMCVVNDSNSPAQSYLEKHRARIRDGYAESVQRAMQSGSGPRGIDPEAYACMLYSFLLGLSVQARDGVSFAVLDAAVTQLLSDWRSMVFDSSTVVPTGGRT